MADGVVIEATYRSSPTCSSAVWRLTVWLTTRHELTIFPGLHACKERPWHTHSALKARGGMHSYGHSAILLSLDEFIAVVDQGVP